MKISNKSVIHKRLKCFVNYIATEKEKLDEIKAKADDVRDCIESQAKKDGYTILSSPYSGSFASKTGLRRSLRGNDEVEGQDVDIAFVLKDSDKNGKPLGCLIKTFEGYLDNRWPSSDTGHTKSSATIKFSGAKQQYDAVPLIETNRKNIQKLIRLQGKDRQSSVVKHKEFMKSRTEASDKIDGVVRFNECVRLMKWWRYQQQSESSIFGNSENDKKIPSFLMNLLCAHAYDKLGVKETYAGTLAEWFGLLHHVTHQKSDVVFDDFSKKHSISQEATWRVIDPVDDSNNIVQNWSRTMVAELSDWLSQSRDRMIEAIRHDCEGNDQKSLDCLVQLFGNSISNQCKEI